MNQPTNSRPLDRRRFLRLATLGGTGAALGLSSALGLGACSSDQPGTALDPDADPTSGGAGGGSTSGSGPGSGSTSVTATADLDRRVLVMIALDGGNDGLDTLVPYGDGRYGDLRPNIGLDLESVLEIDDDLAWNPNLGRLRQRGLAGLAGVGTPSPDLSHFESMRRWWEGDPTGTNPQATGFLGRLCDELDIGAAVTGLSIDLGPSPALRSNTSVTLSIPDPDSGWWLSNDDPWVVTFRDGVRRFGAVDDEPGLLGTTRANIATAFDFADAIGELPEVSEEYPGSGLGRRLELTSRLLAADTGLRVVHVPISGFDTHDDHRSGHDDLLNEVDEATDVFLADLGARGMADRVLVATYSEFGRRVPENDGGTDHGAASVALLAGPVVAGAHGEYPSLGNLDNDDNLMATVGMDAYYATLAEGWFGVAASDVLDGKPQPIPGLFHT